MLRTFSRVSQSLNSLKPVEQERGLELNQCIKALNPPATHLQKKTSWAFGRKPPGGTIICPSQALASPLKGPATSNDGLEDDSCLAPFVEKPFDMFCPVDASLVGCSFLCLKGGSIVDLPGASSNPVTTLFYLYVLHDHRLGLLSWDSLCSTMEANRKV